MMDAFTDADLTIYSGYNYIGYCKEFKWKPAASGFGSFSLEGLVCEYDVEDLMLSTDLFLRSKKKNGVEEYVLRDFVITDVSQLEKLEGSARECDHPDSGFLSVKTVLADEQAIISEETQIHAFKAISEVVHNVKNDAVINPEQTREVTSTLVDEVLRSPDAILNLMDIRTFDDYTFTHNVNVSTISLLIGESIGLSRDELEELGTGCLLHDVGKIKIPIEILHKDGSLNDEEFLEMKSHPKKGYDILIKSRGLSEQARLVCLQHHEKFQGGGYPGRLKGDEITLFARICAVADVYDALTTNRPYRLAMSPYDAIKILNSGIDRHFDPRILTAFIKKFSIYPSGSLVKLNDASIALVLRNNSASVIRPVIRMISNPQGEKYSERVEVNLAEIKGLYIVGPASNTDVK